MTTLRIEEAKRVLLEHPDWTNEAVADHCGFVFYFTLLMRCTCSRMTASVVVSVAKTEFRP